MKMTIQDILKKEDEIKKTANEGYDLIRKLGDCCVDDDGKKLSKEEYVEFVWRRFNCKEFVDFCNKKIG